MAERPSYDALCRAERNVALGSEDGVVIASAVMAEAVLQHLLATRLAAAAQQARAELPRDRGLGDLLGLARRAEEIAGETVLSREQRSALNELNRLRILVAHSKEGGAKVEMAAQRALLRQVLVPLAEDVGALSPSEALRARRDARRRTDTARVDLELDREPQKRALTEQLPRHLERPLLLVFLDGEKRQGHGVIAELLRSHLNRHVPADWAVIGGASGVTWPRLPHEGSRLAKLLEGLGRALGATADVPRADPREDPSAWSAYEAALRDRILALQDLHDGVVIRHRVRPQAGDDAIVADYLERVWLPAAELAAERVAHAALAVCFEIERARHALWWSLPAWWEAIKERRLARRIGRSAPRAPSANAIVLPVLERVPRAALVAYLSERGVDEVTASRMATELLRQSEGGYFDDLVCEIERTVGEERRDSS